jgi:hypothetical protein
MVTVAAAAHSICYVPARVRASRCGLSSMPRLALTKRRAVDFCRVSTAICPDAAPRGTRP